MNHDNPRPGTGYALRFISGKYQGGEFPLPPAGEIVIGRSSELDMVLVEDMVSRRHAKITVTDGQIFIQDLGSTNGSFVNGEKIKRARLDEGDRILIGTSIIKVIAAEGAPSSMHEAKVQMAQQADRRGASQVRTMTGSIGEVPLPDLLQLFSTSKKTGTLVVTTDEHQGKIFLERGKVVYALIDEQYDSAPEKAFYRIVTWTEGTFDMAPAEARNFPRRIEMSTEGLLMESMRHLDEQKRLDDAMPSRDAYVALAQPLIPPLRELEPEELDVLQLALNYGQIGSILDKSLATDSETSTILIRLMAQGYLAET